MPACTFSLMLFIVQHTPMSNIGITHVLRLQLLYIQCQWHTLSCRSLFAPASTSFTTTSVWPAQAALISADRPLCVMINMCSMTKTKYICMSGACSGSLSQDYNVLEQACHLCTNKCMQQSIKLHWISSLHSICIYTMLGRQWINTQFRTNIT